MSTSATMTIRIATDTKRKLERLAADTRRSKSFLAAEAVSAYVERELAMVKVRGRGENRMEALRLSEAFRGRVVDATVEVTQCGWGQEKGNATLRLALKGTVSADKVRVKIASGALTAPRKAGTYAVSVSSWAFETQAQDVTVASGPVK